MFIKKIFLLIIFIPAILFGQIKESIQELPLRRDVRLKYAKNRRKLVIRKGQNYFNRKLKKWIPITQDMLNLKSESISEYDFRAGAGFLFRCKANLGVYKIEDNGNYVIYRPVGIKPDTVIRRNNTILGVNAWTSTNFILYDIPEGIKSKIVLKNVNAPNKFVFQVLSNLIWKVEKNRILFGDLFITELFGLDSDGEVVKVYVFLKNISDKYFVTVDIDTSGHSFPIVVDPSITYQEGASGYSGCYDTYLREDYPSSNCGSNEYLTIGGDGTFWSHILIKFDNINIPPSAIIDYANLQFKLGFVRGEPDAISFRIGILKRNWGEGTATWNTYDGSNSWATAGAEGVGTDIQTDTLIHTTASKSAGDTVIVDITSLFQKVRGIDSVYTDYGFVFDMESYYGSHSSHQYNFYSSENATISDRPILSIECHYADTINKLIFGDYDGSSVKIDSFQYTNNQAGWYDVYIYNTYIEKYFNANGDTTSTPVYMDKDSWKGVRLKNIGLLSVNIFKFADIGDNLVYYDTLNTSDYIINRIKNLFRFNRNTKIR